jgi:cytochrome b involved in lipid metabolism
MVYGTDYDVTGAVDSHGDILLVADEENMKQSIKKRLLTFKGGYYYFDTDYGTDLIITTGYSKDKATYEHIKLVIETELLKDERISNVKVTDITEHSLKMTVTLFNDEEINIGYDIELNNTENDEL